MHLKFTGDYSKLKYQGYKFMKLYARNYMSWSKNGVFIFKVGKDITHGEYDLAKLVRFMSDYPGPHKHIYKIYHNNTHLEYDYRPYTETW